MQPLLHSFNGISWRPNCATILTLPPKKFETELQANDLKPVEWQPGAAFEVSDSLPLSAPIPIRKISYEAKISDLESLDEDIAKNLKKMPHLMTRQDCIVEVFSGGKQTSVTASSHGALDINAAFSVSSFE